MSLNPDPSNRASDGRFEFHAINSYLSEEFQPKKGLTYRQAHDSYTHTTMFSFHHSYYHKIASYPSTDHNAYFLNETLQQRLPMSK